MKKVFLAVLTVALLGWIAVSCLATSRASRADSQGGTAKKPPGNMKPTHQSGWEPAPAEYAALESRGRRPAGRSAPATRQTRQSRATQPARRRPTLRHYPKSRYRHGILVREPATDPTYSAVIKRIARRYRVPAGILYGIWKKESSWLKGGWANGGSWHYAPTLVRRHGPCVGRYGYAKCKRHWDAIRAICSQKRNGLPICDPRQVRVSYAGAMGPMQHMPGVLLWCKNGPCRWAKHALDYDGDGTVDPHYLPEAMAMTAVYLVHRFHYKQCRRWGQNTNRRWQCAVNLYFGIGTSTYFSGGRGRAGVLRWWRRWCRFGHCDG